MQSGAQIADAPRATPYARQQTDIIAPRSLHVKSARAKPASPRAGIQDGAAGASFELRADVVRFLSSRDEMALAAVEGDPADVQEENDIPF